MIQLAGCTVLPHSPICKRDNTDQEAPRDRGRPGERELQILRSSQPLVCNWQGWQSVRPTTRYIYLMAAGTAKDIIADYIRFNTIPRV